MRLPGRNGLRMRGAIALPSLGLTVPLIPKSASSSVLLALAEGHPGCLDRQYHCDHPPTSQMVVLWREPTERAWSAYKFAQKYQEISMEEEHRGRLSPDHQEHYYPPTSLPWDAFLHELARNRGNHYMVGPLQPQSEYCKGSAKYIIIPWDFKEMANFIEVAEIPHANQGKNQKPLPDITPEMQYHLDLVYGADYRIWELIT